MRVNIYAEEMTDRLEIISKEIDGRNYTGLRFYLELPATHPVTGEQVKAPFMHRPGDDDSSAVTFWGKRDLRKVLRDALEMLDKHYAAATQQEGSTATLRARISELERERDALSLEKVNVSIQLAAASRFTYDQESGWEIPAEPNPMHADTFVEALQLFMEMVDREDKKQRDALTAAHTALEGLLNVFRTHAPVDVYERHTKAVDAARAALADTTEQPSVREPNAPAPNKELEEL